MADNGIKQVWNGKWDLNTPPVEGAFLTDKGWEIPLAGTDPALGLTEVLVTMAQAGATVAAGPANIQAVAFDKDTYAQGATIKATVTYNEKVDAVVGATMVLHGTGATASITLTAPVVAGKNKIVFTGTVPAETTVLSIAAQTITGTITDTTGGAVSDKAITAPQGTAAGTRSVA